MFSPEPFTIPEEALSESFIASSGPGGQNVNSFCLRPSWHVIRMSLRVEGGHCGSLPAREGLGVGARSAFLPWWQG
jgi:hypothetical protein